MNTKSVTCKKCKAVGWIEAIPLKKRVYQTAVCTACGKRNYIFTRKWGKTIQF